MKRRNLFLNGLAFLTCLFLFAGGLSAQNAQKKTVRAEFGTTSWTVPTTLNGTPIKVTSVTIEAWGGGGAGGFCDGKHYDLSYKVSGGGGGGAYDKVTINDPVANEVFTLSIGAGGYNTAEDDNTGGEIISGFENRTEANGGTTTVKRGSTLLLNAAGGFTVSGINTLTGAAGGADNGIGDVHYAGGKGGDAAYDCNGGWPIAVPLPGRRSSGGGGGAAGPNGPGGNGVDAHCAANTGWGAGGTSSGAGGAGGRGTSDFNNVFGGKPVGAPGETFGGGGGGTKTYDAWHSGGRGANGGVLITYTYTSEGEVKDVDVNNAATSVCSDASIDIPLNVTLLGIAPANVTVKSITTDLTNATISYNTEDEKFHFTANAYTNPNTTAATFTATCKLKDNTTVESNEFTVTVTVYGKLDGGTIAENQLVCSGKDIQTLVSTADATGGSGSDSYQWWQYVIRDEDNNAVASPAWEQISGVDAPDYTPQQKGLRKFKRVYVDACGTAESNVLEVVTVDPFEFDEDYSSKDTICSNAGYNKTLGFSMSTPAGSIASAITWGVYWQKSVNGGAWENLNSTITQAGYNVNLLPGDFADGDDIWYRAAVKINDCDSIPSNAIYKLHVREVPNYDGQFPDINITLWYGACDTSIANLPAPKLNPVPAEITRADEYTRVAPGEYTIKWRVKPVPDCDIYDTYNQKVIVKYPDCGTVENPDAFKASDDQGNEYQTIRIGCECWLAENLRTNAAGAVYYDEDEANKPFGKLYDWNAAVAVNNTEMTAKTGAKYIQGVCPEGWSIPSVGQYTTLMGEGLDALKSNEEGTWLPGKLGTNASGFNMKGAGLYEAGQFKRMLGYADFWTSGTVEGNSTVATAVEARYDCDEMMPKNMNKENKISVRCVRIEPAE